MLHPLALANLRHGQEAPSARLQAPASSPSGLRLPAVTLEAAPGQRQASRTVKIPSSRGGEVKGTGFGVKCQDVSSGTDAQPLHHCTPIVLLNFFTTRKGVHN